MNDSKRSLIRMIKAKKREIKSEMTDLQIFTSAAFKRFAKSVLKGVGKIYNADFELNILTQGDMIACTSGSKFFLNVNNLMVQGLSSREEKFNVLTGSLCHEVSHTIWTNMKYVERIADEICQKKFPMDYGKHSGMEIRNLFWEVMNIIEDGAIERQFVVSFPGYAGYLTRKKDVLRDFCKKMMQNNQNNSYTTDFLNDMLMYAKFDEPATISEPVKDLMDDALSCTIGIKRVDKEVELMKEVLKILDSQASNSPENSSQQQGSDNSGSSNNSSNGGSKEDSSLNKSSETVSDGNDDSSKDDSTGDNSSEGDSSKGNSSEGDSSKGDSSGSGDSQNAENASSGADLSEGALNSIVSDPSSSKLEGNQNSLSQGIELSQSNQVQSSNADNTNKKLDEIANDAAETELENRQEKEISNENQKIAGSMNHGNYNASYPLIVKSFDYPAYDMEYDKVAAKQKVILNKLTKIWKKELKDIEMGGLEDSLYTGEIMTELYRRDLKRFGKYNSPTELPELSIALLVDMSGSMRGERIIAARDAAILMGEFCEQMGVPFACYGHYDSSGTVITPFVEFGSLKKNKLVKIADMPYCIKGRNRDGQAVRFVVEKLKKQNTDKKLLIIISDGQPNSANYSFCYYENKENISFSDMGNAKLDIMDICKKAHNDRITIMVAGLSDDYDKAVIRDLWQYGIPSKDAPKFIGISELEEMPKKFVQYVKKMYEI